MDPVPLLRSLVRAAGKGPDAVLAELDAPLRAAGLTPRTTRSTPSAVMWTRGTPKLALSGHVDVVPVGEGWQRDPHGGDLAEDRVWGRGASDMLGGVAAFAAAAARTREPCAILLTTDEETTMNAARHALDEGSLAGIEAVVVGEPTNMDVGIAEKGVLWLKLTARGKNAHGSMPELGDNAAEKLVRALHRIAALRWEGEHALLGKPTLNLGTLRSGEAVNQVPASAMAELDMRYLPGTRSDAVIERLRTAASEPLEVEVLSDHAPFEIAPDSRLARAAVTAAGTRTLGLPYGTEASKYAPAGIPCVILGPGEPGLAHTNRESVRVDSLERAVSVYARLIEEYA
ncbi:MAG TPA: M20/M25/M40 family metallo-hydrolase [Planctomycetota bacterium]|nr:M20/M25/M40 family metallo-hydrolase [Planctomycetota bacterium]